MASLDALLAPLGIQVSAESVVAKAAFLAFFAIGTLYAGRLIFLYIRVLFSLFILPGASLSKFGPKGSWAVITGASDGIGKEFALQIARKGFNVVLVSRTQSKLETLAQEISTKYASVQTKVLAMDFSQNNDADYTKLTNLVENLDVSILINNVGVSHPYPVQFLETPYKEMTDIITVNCMGTLRVTRIVAPGMVKRKRGLVLTMASFGGLIPTSLLATYSGSKAFLQHWSAALGAELEPSGVTVELVQSYLVTSAMSKVRRASAIIPSPKAFVGATLGKIGRSGGAQGIAFTTTPFWTHGLMHWFLLTFTGTMSRLVIGQVKAGQEDIRRRALRKLERESKKST